jgi:hypothetical protein
MAYVNRKLLDVSDDVLHEYTLARSLFSSYNEKARESQDGTKMDIKMITVVCKQYYELYGKG